MIDLIAPEWPVPRHVRAVSTTRGGGVSGVPYDSLNLAHHVGDAADCVKENRRRLCNQLGIEVEPLWLNQVHGANVVMARTAVDYPLGDAVVSDQAGPACVILTADCLPVLFASTDGTRVGAAHAGWRGMVAGVLEATVAAMAVPPRELLVWFGPAIGPGHFEVGAEVRAAFVNLDPAAAAAFRVNARGRWQADLYRLARQHLNRAGIDAIYGGGRCTFEEADLFFSYRRDGECGRMATLIWIE
jgi:YfiH family protein